MKEEDILYSMNYEDYEIGTAIGFGSSAIVYIALYKPLLRTVAVKMIELDRFERNQIDELRKEILIMTLCKHPHLLPILATFVNESKLWIVTPYLAGGSCLDILRSYYHYGMEETIICTILYQALKGVDYLHKNGHIHRDIKSGNLLIDKDGTVQLADFGVSASLMEDAGERKGIRKTFVGTPCWMAPEVMEMTRGYNSKADIWSFGITGLELAYGSAPFAKYPPMKVIYLTLSNNPPTLDRNRTKNKYSKSFKDMLDHCLQRDPSKRSSAEQLLKHPFFKQAKKPIFLLQHLLAGIPPVNERPIREDLKNSNIPDEINDTTESWDFDEEDDGSAQLGYKDNYEYQQDTLIFDEENDSNISDLIPTVEARKGRFSVVEGGILSPSATVSPPPVPSVSIDCKKSRFKVESVESSLDSTISDFLQ